MFFLGADGYILGADGCIIRIVLLGADGYISSFFFGEQTAI
jgi:hypothetical protein